MKYLQKKIRHRRQRILFQPILENKKIGKITQIPEKFKLTKQKRMKQSDVIRI